MCDNTECEREHNMTRRIEEMTFAEWSKKVAFDIIGKKIMNFNDDHVILVCGDEGKRKSTFTTATYCEVCRLLGRNPQKEFLCYSWEEYRTLNLFALKSAFETLSDKTQAMELLGEYGIEDINGENYSDLWKKKYNVKKGDILVFDEAGTEINCRDSQSANNKDFNSLMIKNRFLGLVHFLNVPKPMSLDNYPREQRARGMIWCTASYNDSITDRHSRIYFYTKDTYSEIFCQRRYWNLFSNQDKLIKHCPPDFEITKLGDMRDYIPKDVKDYYDSRKWAYNISVLLKDLKNSKKMFDEERLVKPGESKQDWYNRTKQDPRTYSALKIWK